MCVWCGWDGLGWVVGVQVGAGILAIPGVTEDAGFLASAPTCVMCWLYMVPTRTHIHTIPISIPGYHSLLIKKGAVGGVVMLYEGGERCV